jgi:hypothetical protein
VGPFPTARQFAFRAAGRRFLRVANHSRLGPDAADAVAGSFTSSELFGRAKLVRIFCTVILEENPPPEQPGGPRA